MTDVFIKRGNLHSGKGNDVETQGRRTREDRTEIGLMQLQVRNAKDCWSAAATGKRQGRILPRASEEVALCTSSLQDCGRKKCLFFFFFELPSKESYHVKKFGLSSS